MRVMGQAGRLDQDRSQSVDGKQWAGIGDEDAIEPHGNTTTYVREGMLEVSLDCEQHVKMFLQKDVFDGNIDTTCDLRHQKRATK